MKVKKTKPYRKTTEWMKLESSKQSFFEIVNALNRYYESLRGSEDKDPRSFRRRLVKSDPDRTEIYFQRFGDYEYLIFAKIESKDKSESDSWIHIDGIAMERDEIRGKGSKKHPAFRIQCVQDLYESSCIPVSEAEKEWIESEA
ncbi:LIC_13246 family protein [Leptospira wolffii]|uniref:LIC_13246 family protein n=1 Tax=Leptospira wolffii TaxID=409998 RepID=A0ABV5BIL2_9LEPT|nr:hypothetical protein [Leptospira wolffii]TGL54206.1 hypothetical protein EHQ61_02670 [Leptospira wolffii]